MDAFETAVRDQRQDAETWMLGNVLSDAGGVAFFFNALCADVAALGNDGSADTRAAAARIAARVRAFERLFEGIARAYLHEPEGIVVRTLVREGAQTTNALLKACQADAIDCGELTTIRPVLQSLLDKGVVERDDHMWRLKVRAADTVR